MINPHYQATNYFITNVNTAVFVRVGNLMRYGQGTESKISIQPITASKIIAQPIRMLRHGMVTTWPEPYCNYLPLIRKRLYCCCWGQITQFTTNTEQQLKWTFHKSESTLSYLENTESNGFLFRVRL